jgi:MFS family permease
MGSNEQRLDLPLVNASESLYDNSVDNSSLQLNYKQPHRAQVYNILHLSTCFCFVFMAYSVSQSYQTSSDHPSQGSNALGILYGFFTATNLIVPYILSVLGIKASLFLGSVCYVAFVAANISYSVYSLYIFSALNGIGASLIWTSQGAYTSYLANLYEYSNDMPKSSQMGYFNGIFWSIFQCNQMIGNSLAGLLFMCGVSVSTVFAVMTGLGALGSAGLLFIKLPNRQDIIQHKQAKLLLSDDNTAPHSTSFFDDSETELRPFSFSAVFGGLKLLSSPRLLLLLPITIYSGLSQGYIWGEFPTLIESNAKKFFILAFLGGLDASSSALAGKFSDRIGRFPIFCIGLIVHLAAGLIVLFWSVEQTQIGIFLLLAALLAIGDGVFNTQVPAVLGTYFEGSSNSDAFGNYKLFQAGSSALAFLYREYMGLPGKTYIIGAVLAVGFIVLTLGHRKYSLDQHRIDKKKYNNLAAEA